MPRAKVQENISQEAFLIPYEKKKAILAVILIVFASLTALSIISYSAADYPTISEFSIYNLYSLLDRNSELSLEIAKTKNWLGLFGAIVSYFFVDGTIGYFSIVVPFLLVLWGVTLLRNGELRIAGFYSNIFLGGAILLATLFGILANSVSLFRNHREIYGIVGAYLGELCIRIFGGAGSLILIVAMLVLTAYLVLDFNMKNFVALPVRMLRYVLSFIGSKFNRGEKPAAVIIPKGEEPVVITPEDLEPKQTVTEKKQPKQEPVIPKISINEREEVIKPPAGRIEIDTAETVKPKLKEKKKKTEDKQPKEEESAEEKTNLLQPWDEDLEFKSPTLELLDLPTISVKVENEELSSNAELLRAKLALFDIEMEKITVTPGPVVTLYEIVPSPGVKISRIVSLQDDIALALAARGIRIIAPIPGKSAIGVEIPNHKRETIYLRSILGSPTFGEMIKKMELPLALGKTTVGETYIADLSQMPHLLVAGATGSGKSVGINTIICSLLYSKHPSDVKFVIIDPKKIELSFFKGLRKHFLAVCPDINEDIITTAQNALTTLKSVELEMDRRYDILAQCGVRHIKEYNNRLKDGRIVSTEEKQFNKMPYIIVIIDELADLMITAGREIEEPIARIAQLARAVGIHLILATQRPSVDVITGTIKANFTARIAYQTATKIDSKTILDFNGAEHLLGKGDMLFLPSDSPKPFRLQNALVSTAEVEKIMEFVESQEGYANPYHLPSLYEKKKNGGGGSLDEKDELFRDAARLIVRLNQCSVTLLQRKFKIGYARAARVVDELEEAGIVGPYDGSKARQVLIDDDEQLDRLFDALESI